LHVSCSETAVRQEPAETDEEKNPEQELAAGLQETLRALICSPEASQEKILPRDLSPWWPKAFEEVAKSLLGPGEELAELPESKQAFPVGKELGRIMAFCRQFREGFPFQKQLVGEEEVVCHTVLLGLNPIVQGAEREYRHMLSEAWDHRPCSWLAEFYRGFAAGFSGGVINEQGQAVGATPQLNLYLLFMIGWRKVEEFRKQSGGAPKLHSWVCTAMGPGFKMDIETFRRFCRRLGIRFERSGRPPQN
jgi:hypothetical protein